MAEQGKAKNAGGTVEFTGLAQGGAAVGRLNGQVVFVPYACPGDVARVSLTQDRGRFAEGRLEELLQPSPERTEPFCPAFGHCGGCQWQHVSYARQLAAKAQSLAQNLSRLGGLATLPEIAVHPSATPTGWRQKARLHRDRQGRWGFLAARGHDLIPITSCPLLLPELNTLVAAVAAWLTAQKLPVEEFSVGYSPIEAQGAAHFRLSSQAELPSDRLAAMPREIPALAGLVVEQGGQRHTFGQVELRLAPATPLADTLHPIDAFWQAHHTLNLEARATLGALLAKTPQNGAILELFCGAGNLSTVLAERGAALWLNDAQGVALEAARQNLSVAGQARFLAGSAEEALGQLGREGARIATLVLDPPRAGFKEGLAHCAALGLENVLYQSCDGATFARDARALAQEGFVLSALHLFDFFPQSYHAESLALFCRT